MKRLLFLYGVVIVSLLHFWGCDEVFFDKEQADDTQQDTPKKVLSVTLDYDSLLLFIGDSDTLKAIVRRGDEPVDSVVLWESDNDQVAVVDSNGVVTALSVGSALISAKYLDSVASCRIIVERPNENGFEYVDLGLSVKWAKWNVGAENPEDYGDYFAWGETEPKSTYTWDNYCFYIGIGGNINEVQLSKYVTNSRYGTVDSLKILVPEDDVAHVKWGGNWRIPSSEEFQELKNNCTWTKTAMNGVNGYLVTSKVTGYTDRSIFLPAAGSLVEDNTSSVGTIGFYWLNSLGTMFGNLSAMYFSFGSYEGINMHSSNRYYGHSVRAVCP